MGRVGGRGVGGFQNLGLKYGQLKFEQFSPTFTRILNHLCPIFFSPKAMNLFLSFFNFLCFWSLINIT